MNLITEIKEIINQIDLYAISNYESPELIAQLKLLNGKIELLKKAIESGKIQDEFEKKFTDLKNIQYSIHHQLLFGPLSRIIGLVSLIEYQIEQIRIGEELKETNVKEINSLSHLLIKEIKDLKMQILVILDGSGGLERCDQCGKKKLK